VFTIAWISLRVATLADVADYAALSWTFYVGFVCIVTQVRTQVRRAYGIDGSVVEDFLASGVLYPMVLMQCAVQVETSIAVTPAVKEGQKEEDIQAKEDIQVEA
jgi:hypothetical protein